MEFRLLGPLQVLVDGAPVGLRGAAERALLARLLLEAGRVVPAEHLIDTLWGADLPANAVNALQGRVSRLRSAFRAVGLPETVVVSRRPGYLLDVNPDTVDVHRFTRLLDEARRGAPDRYPQALALWQGPALAELTDQGWARDQRQRLDELRLAATEEWLDARLAAGQHAELVGELVGELTDLVARYPLRERLHGQLMLALYRAGRQADALAAFQRARRILDDELGLDPSPQLRALEQATLRQDPTLAAPPRPAQSMLTEVPLTAQPLTAQPLTEEPLTEEPPGSERAPELAEGWPTLAARLTSFVGRDRERATLAELLAARRLVTLTGPGGVGKTSLAVQVATDIAADVAGGPGTLDGVFFVPLAGVAEPGALAPAVADAVGAPTGPGTAEDRMLRRLRRREALVVLDNCEHLLVACADLAAGLLGGCPGVRLLATSREPLGIAGEAQFPLVPLPTPPEGAGPVELLGSDAVRLFVDRARDADPGFVLDRDTAPAVAHICRRLDGLPLALELAAARVKLLDAAQIAARLDDRFRLLTSGPRTADARQRTLRAAIDWSHQLLTDPERVLFRRLAVFHGGWSLHAAEQVCADPDSDDLDILDLHARLVDRSLVVPRHGPGFGMLETLREYAAERLDQAGERERIEAAHAAYMTRLAGDAERRLRGAGQDGALALLRAERDNLRAALAWGRTHPGAELGLWLAAALGWFWYFTSAQDGVAELEAMLAAVPVAAAPSRARALQALSVAARPGSCIVHPDPRCAGAARESLELFIEAGDTTAAAYSTTLLAVEAIAGGDPGGSLAMLEQAAAAFDRAADRWGLALADFVRMELQFLVGDPDNATRHGAQALDAFRELDDHWGVSAVQYHHGLALHRAGRLPAALAVHEAALTHGRRATTNTVPYVLADMGHIALQLGELDRAAQHLTEAHVVARQLGADGNPVAAIGDAHLARERSDPTAAHQHYEAALRLLAGGSTPEWEAAAHNGLGFLACLTGDLDTAEFRHRVAWQAATRAPAAGARAGATALEGLAGAAAARGDGTRAANLLGTAARWRELRHQPALRTERHDIDRAAAAARDLIGTAAYGQAYTHGLQLPPDAVVDLCQPAHPQLAAWLREPVRPA